MSKAVYAGAFDPITNGHLDIIKRSKNVFGSLIVCIASDQKKGLLFDASQRKDMVEKTLKSEGIEGVEVRIFSGLLVNELASIGASTIVRGLRAESDYGYEAQIAMTNRKLNSSIETVFFVTDERNSFLSSSIVKDVAKHGGDVSSLVPSIVVEKLKKIYNIAT